MPLQNVSVENAEQCVTTLSPCSNWSRFDTEHVVKSFHYTLDYAKRLKSEYPDTSLTLGNMQIILLSPDASYAECAALPAVMQVKSARIEF